MGVCLSLAGLIELECVTDLHLNLVQKKIKKSAGDQLFYSKALSQSCAGVVCVCACFLRCHTHTHTPHQQLGPDTAPHPLQVTGITCTFPE